MYALLSSILTFLVQPLTWLLTILLALIFIRSGKWKLRLGIIAAGVALIFTNPWLHHTISMWWEPEPVPIESIKEPFEVAVVLGGFTRLHATPIDRLHLGSEPNRFTQAIELYRLGKVRRLVFVSGGKSNTTPPVTEADLATRTAIRFSIPEDSIIALGTSRNTHENAVEYRAWSEDSIHGERSVLLVTSAFHARRAGGCFRKEGIRFSLFPTDHRSERNHSGRKLSLSNTLLPNPPTILAWGTLFREWTGMAVYRLRGWI